MQRLWLLHMAPPHPRSVSWPVRLAPSSREFVSEQVRTFEEPEDQRIGGLEDRKILKGLGPLAHWRASDYPG